MPDEAEVIYTPIYTTLADLHRLYGANKRTVRIGSSASDDISSDDMLRFLRDAERWVTAKLAKRYVIPLVDASEEAMATLATIALYRAGYVLWLGLPGTQYQGEPLPESVKAWKETSRDLIKDIVAGLLDLDGATLKTRLSSVVVENRQTIYTKSEGEDKTVDDDNLDLSEEGIYPETLDGGGP